MYGASNVTKLLHALPESSRADAVASLVYEAEARVKYSIRVTDVIAPSGAQEKSYGTRETSKLFRGEEARETDSGPSGPPIPHQ